MEKELRLGNLVYTIKKSDVMEVVRIETSAFNKFNGFDDYQIILENTLKKVYYETNNITPILLTKEWLIKFGFNETSYGWINGYIFNKFGISIEVDYQNNIFLGMNNTKIKKLDYVHQFQNLYYLLTDEELKLI